MSEINFNVNETVKVKLTDLGREIHKSDSEAILRHIPSFEHTPAVEDADGWSEWQLWHLMNVFGTHLGNGRNLPFETTIRLSTPSTDTEEG